MPLNPMTRIWMPLLLLAGTMTIPAKANDLVLETKSLTLRIDDLGVVRELGGATGNRDYLHPSKLVPFCQVRRFDSPVRLAPETLSWKAAGDSYAVTIGFAGGITAEVGIQRKPDYLLCELKSITHLSDIEFFIWGPCFTTIDQTIGGSVGVVRNDTFALGIRPMNFRTQGGSDAEAIPEVKADDGFLAIKLEDEPGSRLGAFTKNRTRTQDVPYGKNLLTRADAIGGETVVGSRIAIFGTRPANVLDLLEAMILAEGLPHPTWKGVWTKRSNQHTRPRLIIPFSETNVEQCIDIAKEGSFAIVYHKAPYQSKGTFLPREDDFPSGWDGLKSCADKIRAAGLEPGMHNLSTFMSPDDPYCSPIPNKNLAVHGVTELGADIGTEDDSITLDPATRPGVYEFHQEARKPIPKVIRIGDELIQYRTATTKPYQLLDCKRGAWGTKAAAHQSGDTVGRVLTHKYKVFFPNIILLPEIAENLARSLNKSGIRSISYDGLVHRPMEGKTRIFPDMRHHITHIEPGGESGSLWTFVNHYSEQPLQFVIRIAPGQSGSISNPTVVLNEVHTIEMDLKLQSGQYIACPGDGTATLYDKKHKALKSVEVPVANLLGRKGKTKPQNSISFNHDRGPKGDLLGPDVIVNVRTHKRPKDAGPKKAKQKT